MPSKSFEFYRNLNAFNDFTKIIDGTHFVQVPYGWNLVLSDIKGSTRAIQEGRYKQVNLIGAATITAYINIAGTNELPFVFGGDGASLLVPDGLLEELLIELRKLQIISKRDFNLDLRVGVISIKDLETYQQSIKIAKYELSPGNYLAQFKGGGLSFAEDLMKSGNAKIKLLSAADDQSPSTRESMAGLSCRLNPLRSTKGRILTLLCKPLKQNLEGEAILKKVVNGLTEILDNDLKSATPVRGENLKWPFFPKFISNEALLKSGASFWLRWSFTALWSLISNWSIRYEIPLGKFNPRKYKNELPINSDFKKFDETLRMVLDCSESQIGSIQNFLKKLADEQLIAFGTHISDSALMTCIVQSPVNNKHIHFIDGADGGYAIAAIQLKNQGNPNTKIPRSA